MAVNAHLRKFVRRSPWHLANVRETLERLKREHGKEAMIELDRWRKDYCYVKDLTVLFLSILPFSK